MILYHSIPDQSCNKSSKAAQKGQEIKKGLLGALKLNDKTFCLILSRPPGKCPYLWLKKVQKYRKCSESLHMPNFTQQTVTFIALH